MANIRHIARSLERLASDDSLDQRTWNLKGPIAWGDQRVALDEYGDIYLYDNSGHDPDNTDDGPLHAKTKQVNVVVDRRGLRFSVPVVAERHPDRNPARSKLYVLVTAAGAAKLVSDYGFSVNIAASARPLLEAYAVLLAKG